MDGVRTGFTAELGCLLAVWSQALYLTFYESVFFIYALEMVTTFWDACLH